MNRKRIILGSIIATACLVAIPLYVICDVTFHGPYVVRFNQRHERIVTEENLIGQLPIAIEIALGKPTSVYKYAEGGSFTYNYAPYPTFPFAKFQAHFKHGKLSTIQLYDD